MEIIEVNLGSNSYKIYIEKGILEKINKYVNLNRRVMIITDDGVPKEYYKKLLSMCKKGHIYLLKSGENSKNIINYEKILKKMLDNNFNRGDLIISLGGGVVGDLGGFVASTYMRGIDFINIPTTTMAQIDSSIGGKNGINFYNSKNMIGSFYHPKGVFIDINFLETLSKRDFYNGLVEGVKAGIIGDKFLFEIFEKKDIIENIEEIIKRSILVKKNIVEQDEKEKDKRMLLNLGHTIGHGLESYFGLQELLHGECVAIGMLKVVENKDLAQRIKKIFNKMGIKNNVLYDKEEVFKLVKNDKKITDEKINIIKVKDIELVRIEKIEISQIKEYL